MNDCLFCKIVKKEMATNFLHEDDQVVVFNDIHPKADTHLLVVPKIHLQSLAQSTPEHSGLLSHILLLLPQLAKQFGLNGFRTIVNTGKEGGQEVDHLHFHLLNGHLHAM